MSDQPPNPASGPLTERWVELRIHGVSGTPPEVMLESEHVQQVAGDAWGRFFRPQDGVHREVQTDPHRTLEGYHWGKYTSGSWLKGLWLILVPFGFVNAAAFMVPDPGDSTVRRWLHHLAQAVIRGMGLAVTGTFAMASALILVDLVAWQWAAGLPWLSSVPSGYVIAAGVLAANLAPLALFVLGNQNRQSPFAGTPTTSLAAAGGTVPQGLMKETFFRVPDASRPTLGVLHLAFGWSVITFIASLTWHRAVGEGASSSLDSLYRVTLFGSLALLGLISLVVLLMGDPNKSVDAPTLIPPFILRVVSGALLGLAFVAAVTSVVLVTQCDRSPVALNFDRYGAALAAVTGGEMILLALLLGALALLTGQPGSHPRPFRRYGGGMAAWAASCVGVFLAVGFCASFVLGLAKALDADERQSELIYRIAYSWGLTVLLVLLVGLCLLVVWVRGWLRARAVADAAYTWVLEPARRAPGDKWPGRTARAMSTARLKWCIAPPFLFFATAGLAMTLVMSVEMLAGVHFWFFDGLARHLGVAKVLSDNANGSGGPSTFTTAMTNTGTYALLGLAGLLFLLGRRSLRAQQTRRGVNVIWDVISFWPHAAHPFVPPAYSQFAVHDLRRRIRYHLGLPPVPAAGEEDEDPGSEAPTIVLSAHSQGSLIAFTTMLWLSEAERRHVRLVTYGSQLQVAYPRGFAAYLDYDLIRLVKDTWASGWVNLYRETDPIAGPVLSWNRSRITDASTPSVPAPSSCRVDPNGVPQPDAYRTWTGVRRSGDDWRVLDPPAVDPQLQDTTLVQLSKHSGYPSTADYRRAVLRVRLRG